MTDCIQKNKEKDNNNNEQHSTPNNIGVGLAKRYTPIRLKQATYNRLKDFKLLLGDELACKTFDDLISNLLDYVENEITGVSKE